MSYAAIDDVKRLNPKRLYDLKTTPTLAQVEQMISGISNEIDCILSGRGLSIPVTAPAEFVARLKLINAQGAAAMAEMAMFPDQGSLLYKQYRDGLESLRSDPLPTAPSSSSQARSFFTEHPTEEPTEDYSWRKPKIGKDKAF